MTRAAAAAAPLARLAPWMALATWVALSLMAGAVGSLASVNARDFYTVLERPAWAPPGWLFGPVWTVLYVLMGVAAWLVWRRRSALTRRAAIGRRVGLLLFVLQLALNALWTWLFFRWRHGLWAFTEIALLWLAIAGVIACFARVRPVAAWLLAPYLAWVTFATALTWAIYQRNPAQL